jgi:hypothetical protein
MQTNFDCGDEDAPFAVGPFVTGQTVLQQPAADIKALLDRLKARRNDRPLLGLILIGSADKTPLLPQLAKQYDSNVGLAQARAEWVRSRLMEDDAAHQLELTGERKIATVISGPTKVGLNIAPTDLAIDRSVRVCAIWGTK